MAVPAMITNTMTVKSINYFPSRRFKLIQIALMCLAVNIHASLAVAQSIRIVDCQGKTRAMQQASPSDVTDVEVKLNSDEINNAKLVNRKGEVIQGEISEGVATFSAVPTDVWVLSTDSPGGFFSQISMNPRTAGFWYDAGNIALVTVGIVGAVLIGGVFDGNSKSDGSSDGSGCATCNPDQEAPSIVPFSR